MRPVVIALLDAALSAAGIRGQAGKATLTSVPRQIARANPDLKTARFMIDEARSRHPGAGRLMNPEIEPSGRRIMNITEALRDFHLARLRLKAAVGMSPSR